MTVLAGILGGLAGVVGCLPFLLLRGKIHKLFLEQEMKALKFVLLVPLASFLLMILAIIVFWLLVGQNVLIFAIVCVAIFLISAVVFTVTQMKH